MLRLKQTAFATVLLGLAVMALVALPARPQSPAARPADTNWQAQVTDAVRQQCESGQATAVEIVRKQLERSYCQLALPPVSSTKLTATGIEQRARLAFLRVGWVYRCTKCDQWHNHLAGGYALTPNGAIATAYHVVNPPRDLRTGALIVADHAGRVFPITEVLAANRYADACIVQANGKDFTPLPLNTNISIGHAVYCLSNSQGQTNDFTQGVVRRFLQLPERRLDTVRGAPRFTPIRIQVSAAFRPGSSGSAVLDECGNAIGHASAITLENSHSEDRPLLGSIFHEATSALDVTSLVRAPK
jgi:serine protease Do